MDHGRQEMCLTIRCNTLTGIIERQEICLLQYAMCKTLMRIMEGKKSYNVQI
jgi:hypothetical protein